MREKDFLRLYVDLYREKGEKISSMKAAKGRIDSIWETLIAVSYTHLYKCNW